MSGGETVRPTKRCLDERGLKPPALDVSLSEIADEPVAASQALPQRYEAGGAERIRSIKDRVWFKVKTGRWRGAATRLKDADLQRERVAAEEQGTDPDITSDHRWWLGSVGWREDGSSGDFYSETATRLKCQKSSSKPHGVDSDGLLPGDWDRKRLRAELAVREEGVYREVMLLAAARSLRSGKVVTAEFDRFSMSVVVRADRGDQFVAFIARNVFDPLRLAVMLASLPGVSKDDWQVEPGGIADIDPEPGELVWSAILTTEAADAILEMKPWSEDDA